MSKAAPWIKFFAGDFLNGIADLDADEIGAYTVILALIWDRGAPIADDAAWLARRSGTSTRRFNQIRAKLLQLGKLEARNGMLGNRRAIAEVQARDRKSDQARTAAFTRWAQADAPELPLGDNGETSSDYLGKKTRKKREKTQEQIDLETGKNQQEPQKSAIPEDADASFPSRAPAYQRPESRVITTEHRNEVVGDADPNAPASPAAPEVPEPIDRGDLVALMQACTIAAGFSPSNPGVISREIDIVKGWRESGIDFELVVLPTIRAIIARTSDPTSSLKRFDKQVRLEHAKQDAQPKANGTEYRPPESPLIEIEGEEPVMADIRRDLLKRMGAVAYCATANHMRLEIVDMGDSPPRDGVPRKPIKVIESRNGFRFMDGDRPTILRHIVRNHGFNEVW